MDKFEIAIKCNRWAVITAWATLATLVAMLFYIRNTVMNNGATPWMLLALTGMLALLAILNCCTAYYKELLYHGEDANFFSKPLLSWVFAALWSLCTLAFISTYLYLTRFA